jgi:hypothetical protein
VRKEAPCECAAVATTRCLTYRCGLRAPEVVEREIVDQRSSEKKLLLRLSGCSELSVTTSVSERTIS